MTRAGRIMLFLLGPPILGALYLWCGMQMGLSVATFLPGATGFVRIDIAMVGFFSGLLAGPAAIVYAIIMELYFCRGLDQNSWKVVGLSSFLGMASGFLMGAIVVALPPHEVHQAFFFVFLGALVGLTLGLIVKLCPKSPPIRQDEPQSRQA